MSPGALIWDLPTRAFHWLLALCFAGSWATAEAGFDWTEEHMLFGYTTVGLIVFRVIWGFVGPEHARFGRFVVGPRAVISYARRLLSRDSEQSTGHNPLGGWMVLILLALMATQAGTGLFISDDVSTLVRWNPLVSASLAGNLAGVHHLNFTFIQAAVALHVLAIVFYAIWKRQNLTTPMLTGVKLAVAPEHGITTSGIGRAAVIAALVAGGVWAMVALAPPPVPIDFY